RVRTLDVPPLPPPLPPRPRLDFGRRVWRHAHPVGPACSRVHLRSVLRFASGFFSTRPHGARPGVSRRQSLHAVASSSRLLPTRPAKDFHLQSSAHARHTSGRATPSLRDAPTATRYATNRQGIYLTEAKRCSKQPDHLYGAMTLPPAQLAVLIEAMDWRRTITPPAPIRPVLV